MYTFKNIIAKIAIDIIIIIALMVWIIAFCMEKTNASEFKEYNYTVWCINLENYQDVRSPKDSSLHWCDYGRKWMRIMSPTKKQYDILIKTFWNKDNVIDVLPIINSESQFNHATRWKNKWWWDCGILQIRDVYGGCKMTVQEQFQWLKTRTDSQKTTKWTCQSWIGNKERMIRCIYNRHNGKLKAYNSYDNKLMAQRKYYISLYK